ncbi:MAG: hypothetical protein ACO3JL_08450, partial [Myxococcota bacterium]
MSWYSHGPRLPDQLTPLLFLEEAVHGRRVLLWGVSASSLANYVTELGAASVISALDDDSSDDEELVILRDLQVHRSRGGCLPFDNDAFDLVLDFDLVRLAEGQRASRVVEIDRVLSPDGCALTLLPAGQDLGLTGLLPRSTPPPTLGYGALTTLLREKFACVEVYFQSLVVGYFFGPVEATAVEQGVIPHTGLMGDDVDPASAWLFAFGNRAPAPPPLTLVQMPTAGLAEAVRAAHGAHSSTTTAFTVHPQAVVVPDHSPSPATASPLAALVQASPEAKAELDDLLDGLEARTRERDELVEELAELERRLVPFMGDEDSAENRDVAAGLASGIDTAQVNAPVPSLSPSASLAGSHVEDEVRATQTVRLRAPRLQSAEGLSTDTPATNGGSGQEIESGAAEAPATAKEADAASIAAELEKLRIAYVVRGTELEKLAAGVNRLMGERDSLRARLQSLTAGPPEDEPSTVGSAVIDVESLVRGATAALQGRLAYLMREVEEAGEERKGRETALREGSAERDELRARLRASQSQLEQRSVELGRSRDALLEVTAQRDLLERLVSSHERDLERLKDELAAAHAETLHERQSAELARRGSDFAAGVRSGATSTPQAHAEWQ